MACPRRASLPRTGSELFNHLGWSRKSVNCFSRGGGCGPEHGGSFINGCGATEGLRRRATIETTCRRHPAVLSEWSIVRE